MNKQQREFFAAVDAGNTTKVTELLGTNRELLSAIDDESEGAPKGDNPIHRACRVGNVNVLNAILAVSMAEKDKPKVVNGIPGPSPLIIATSKQHISVVARLIEVNANVNYINQKDFGYTALFFAISTAGKPGNPAIVQALINAGADVTYKANNGGDPITFAQEKGTSEILSILKKAHQANIDKDKAKLAELEKQLAEEKKKREALAARNENLRANISAAQAQHAQAQNDLKLDFAKYSLDYYKNTVVDGKAPLPAYVPSSVASSKANQAYADAQKKQAQSSSAQTTMPRTTPVHGVA